MGGGADAARGSSCQIDECFVDVLYDASPRWPDEVPRERLLASWAVANDPPEPTAKSDPGNQPTDRRDP
jgi:hypothetical protein